MLEEWYAFENERTREALLEWRARQGIIIKLVVLWVVQTPVQCATRLRYAPIKLLVYS